MASRPSFKVDTDFNRSSLFAAVYLLLIANALAPMAFQDVAQRGLAVSAFGLFGISAVFPLAGYAIWAIARDSTNAPLKRFDWLIVGLAVTAGLFPLHLAAKAALLPLSAYLFATSSKSEASFRIGFIGFALTSAFVWGAILLAAFAGPILTFDAALVQLVTGVPVEGNVLQIDPSASGVAFDKIAIMGGCSSLRNISQAIILWATLVQWFALRVTPALVGSCILAVMSMVVINVVRIALMVAYPEHLVFIHDGFGSSIVSMVALVAAFGIIGIAIVQQQRHLEV